MSKEPTPTLEQQIAAARRTISSDGYPMSIGELTNLYREGELYIRPEFQRFFRWSDIQKSRLVESILLGIPLPSVFVSQREDGKWEIVDGLQRISTILELQGELRDSKEASNKLPPLVLSPTKYLPGLEGKTWTNDSPQDSLTEAQRLDVKRAKLDIKIIKRESSPATKFDLFQRLNSYGSTLNAQEMRSALLVAVSSDFFAWLERLASLDSFRKSIQLSERLITERYDLELALRFLVLHNRPIELLTVTKLRDLPQLLDDEAVALAEGYPANSVQLENTFTTTFGVIASNGAEDVFRRWDKDSKQFHGSFLSTSFEILGLGLGYHIANDQPYRNDLIQVAMELWSKDSMKPGFATGRSTESRLAEFIPLGRTLLKG